MRKFCIYIISSVIAISSAAQASSPLEKSLMSFLDFENLNPVCRYGVVSFEYEGLTYNLSPIKTEDGVSVFMYVDYLYDDCYTRDLVSTVKNGGDVLVECTNDLYRFCSNVSADNIESYRYTFYKQLRILSESIKETRQTIREMRHTIVWDHTKYSVLIFPTKDVALPLGTTFTINDVAVDSSSISYAVADANGRACKNKFGPKLRFFFPQGSKFEDPFDIKINVGGTIYTIHVI